LSAFGIFAFAIGSFFWFRRSKSSPNAAVLALVLASMVLVPHIASLALASFKPVYFARYSVVCIPAVTAILGIAASQIASRTGRIAAIAILACAPMVAGFERGLGIHAVCFADSPMKALAARISKESQTGDILVIYPEFYATSFNWYYRGQLPVVCF